MTNPHTGAAVPQEALQTLQAKIAYSVFAGLHMGRRAQETGGTLMFGHDTVSDEEWARRVAAQVMREAGLLPADALLSARGEPK